MDQHFNWKHPKNHLPDKKVKSLEKIGIVLLQKNIDVKVKEITDKMLSLRNYFSAERQKEEDTSKKSESCCDDLYYLDDSFIGI